MEQKISSTPTRAYFESILITLSDHAGYHIKDDITVYEFGERIRRLNHYIKKLNDNNHHGRK
jgi:hypothetical protein